MFLFAVKKKFSQPAAAFRGEFIGVENCRRKNPSPGFDVADQLTHRPDIQDVVDGVEVGVFFQRNSFVSSPRFSVFDEVLWRGDTDGPEPVALPAGGILSANHSR